jgi:hypothetical protein
MKGAGELANGGALLVGQVEVSGGCSEEGPEPGTFALRRTQVGRRKTGDGRRDPGE